MHCVEHAKHVQGGQHGPAARGRTSYTLSGPGSRQWACTMQVCTLESRKHWHIGTSAQYCVVDTGLLLALIHIGIYVLHKWPKLRSWHNEIVCWDPATSTIVSQLSFASIGVLMWHVATRLVVCLAMLRQGHVFFLFCLRCCMMGADGCWHHLVSTTVLTSRMLCNAPCLHMRSCAWPSAL